MTATSSSPAQSWRNLQEPSYTNQWGAVMVDLHFRVHLCLHRPTWRVCTSLPLNGSPRLPLTLHVRTSMASMDASQYRSKRSVTASITLATCQATEG